MAFRKRIEIVVTDEDLAAFIEEKAIEVGLGVGPYLLTLARALYLFERFGKTTLLGLFGIFDRIASQVTGEATPSPPPPPTSPPEQQPTNTDLVDSVLDNM